MSKVMILLVALFVMAAPALVLANCEPATANGNSVPVGNPGTAGNMPPTEEGGNGPGQAGGQGAPPAQAGGQGAPPAQAGGSNPGPVVNNGGTLTATPTGTPTVAGGTTTNGPNGTQIVNGGTVTFTNDPSKPATLNNGTTVVGPNPTQGFQGTNAVTVSGGTTTITGGKTTIDKTNNTVTTDGTGSVSITGGTPTADPNAQIVPVTVGANGQVTAPPPAPGLYFQPDPSDPTVNSKFLAGQ